MYRLFNINKKLSFICNVQNSSEKLSSITSRLKKLVMKYYCACVEGVYITYLHMYMFTGENTSKFENHKGKT